jgi:hypothetical protein
MRLLGREYARIETLYPVSEAAASTVAALRGRQLLIMALARPPGLSRRTKSAFSEQFDNTADR